MSRRLALNLARVLVLAPISLSLAQGTLSRGDTIGRDDRNFTFYDRGPYRPTVPRPETILGYNVGDLNTQFALQERVLLAIADAARDRIRVEEIGATAERRRLRLYIVSAPENISRLDEIRANLDRLADPRVGSPTELDALAARTPAVVWINESVHGNEAPGFETAMQTLYQLAASDEPATVAALRKVIVVLNPSTNPDGHERFSVWYNSIHVGAPEPFAMEHGEPWSIQGRFNHYRFDMNRDVMTTTQLEAQALVKGMLRWHPMVAVDQHGQTSNYFFPPTAKPLNANMGPDFQKWMEIYGRANAAAFDRNGWMYYSRDVFDFYGPFYWDSWPSLNGAIGMTYETDCGGWKGILWRREDGSLCSFRDGVAKHYVTALATIEATAANSADRVKDFLKFRREAVDEGRRGALRRIVLVPGNDPVGAAELVSTLLRSGIEVRRTTAPLTVARATAYADDATSARRFEAGAYVIDLAQPQGRAARAVLEPTPVLDTAFARSQIEKYRRNIRRGGSAPREGYEFYDVTAWSLPVAFGVEAWWTDDTGPVAGEVVTLPANSPALAIPGTVAGANPARTAYLFRPESRGAARLAYHLLNEGFRVASSDSPLEAGGANWPRGTFVARVGRNTPALHARIAQLAAESGVQVTGVNSAFAEVGQFGVGSGSMNDLRPPRIALVGDNGISQTAYGATWWTFERRYGLTFTPVTTAWLASGELSEFNVIVVPHGFAGALNGTLGKGGADRLRSWMQAGGTLITMGGASAWAANADVNLTSARLVGPEKDAKPDTTGFQTPKADTTPASVRARQSERASAGVRPVEELLAVTSPGASNASPVSLPGSHVDVVLDRTHWLTSGYDTPRLTVLMEGGNFFTLSKTGVNAAVFASSGPLVRSGFAWPDNTERLLRGTAFLIHEPIGGGHLVMFANDPLFRGWWRALDKALMNAILLGPGF